MPQRPKMVVLSPLVDHHVHCGVRRGVVMAHCRVPLLPQGAGAGPQRPQAEGAEGSTAGETGVRGDVHDRSERLGRRTYLWPDHHRPHSGKSTPLIFVRTSSMISSTVTRWVKFVKFDKFLLANESSGPFEALISLITIIY